MFKYKVTIKGQSVVFSTPVSPSEMKKVMAGNAKNKLPMFFEDDKSNDLIMGNVEDVELYEL